MSTLKYKGFARAIGSTPKSSTPKTPMRSVDECGCFEPGIETIQVEQVLGANSAQRVVEMDLFVPSQKPPIEQVIDVYVKDLCIKDISVIPDKVIVRGEFNVKVMYVADLPKQPVHAFEKHNIRWTRDIEVLGADKDMPATADVVIEFVDYDFHRHHDPRKVHITVVLKVWTRVTSTTEMDAYVLTPVVEPIGQVSTTSENVYSASSGSNEDTVSAAQTGGGNIAGFGEQNIIVTGPVTPEAGTTTITKSTATVTGNNVNVRTGPGTNFPSITKVNKGTTVTIKDQAFGWYKVVLADGTVGWIASWLVDTGMPVQVPKG